MKVLQKLKKVLCFMLMGALILGSTDISGVYVSAAKKATLKTKSITMEKGKTKSISIKNKNSKYKYTFKSSKTSVAKVSAKGKVTAVKSGTTKITVSEVYKVKKKSKTRTLGVCKITVKASSKEQIVPTPTVTPSPTQSTPSALPTVVPTLAPTAVPTLDPTAVPTSQPTEEPTARPTEVPAYETMKFDFNNGSTYDFEDANVAEGNDSKCISINGGSRLPLARAMVYGGICKVSASFKQSTGSAKNITVGYDGTYLNYTLSGAYISKSSIDPMSNSSSLSCPSGEWTKLEFEFVIPKYSYDFNLNFTMADGTEFMMDDVQVQTLPCDGADYPSMVKKSALSTGNNGRIKKAIEKAESGQDVTLAYIGGSITEGFAASETKNSDCYAETSYNQFKKAFGAGDGSNVHFINAGMSGTPSTLGVIRYQRDVLNQMKYGEVPDVLFIDFAVNDGGDCAEAYESIIRTALEQGTAVVLMYVLYNGGCALQDSYSKIGTYYDLAMVSPKNGSASCDKTKFDKWFFWPDGHPDVGGHRYMADCIMNLFNVIDEEDTEEDNMTDVQSIKAFKGDSFVGMKTLESSTDISKHPSVKSLSVGGFSQKDTAQNRLQYIKNGVEKMLWFPDAWAHSSTSGNESFKATITCNSLSIAYKQASGTSFGAADVYVDGVKVATMKNSTGGWNNAQICVALSGTEVKTHEIEIKMASGDESKAFTIFAIGYANINEFTSSLPASSIETEYTTSFTDYVDIFFENRYNVD